MGVLNFDYKLNATITPIVHKYFTYNIYAEVHYSNGVILNEKVYEVQGEITNQNLSYDTAKVLSESTVSALATDGINALKVNDPNLQVNRYVMISQNPFLYILCEEDGSSSPVAWDPSMYQDDVLVKTSWINGPQIDTDVNDSAENAIQLSQLDVSALLNRYSAIDLPPEFQIKFLEVVSNNSQVVVIYDEPLKVFGIDVINSRIYSVRTDQTSVELTNLTTAVIQLHVDMDDQKGFNPDYISYVFSNNTIAKVDSIHGNQITIRALQEGSTNLQVAYNEVMAAKVSITVVKPQANVTITKSQEHTFIGDPTEIHVMVDYSNGELFEIQSTTLTLTSGNATIEKMDEATYKLTSQTLDPQMFDLQVVSKTGNIIDSSITLPVWEKKLYRFHVLPDQVTVVKGQEFVLEAFYTPLYTDMLHDDNQIEWEIVSGQDLVTLKNTTGKTATIQATGQGTIEIKASVYGSENTVSLRVVGESDSMIHLSENMIQMAPGTRKTLYAQVLNGDAGSITWNVQDNGFIKVVSQNSSYITFDAIVDGTASIEAVYGDLYQQATITVSEMFLQAMSDPDLPTGELSTVQTYYPSEDSGDNWTFDNTSKTYVNGNGTSTLLYGKAQGSNDPVYAFHSGIGDNDDLFVKPPQAEDIVEAFQYAARLRGHKKHQIMIYPEINFQYGVQYKGDLEYDYNESPFQVAIDAYPSKPFEFSIQENRKLESKRDYEVQMDIGGVIPTKPVEYAVDWTAQYQTSNFGDVKSLFTSNKGTYLGYGDSSVWVAQSDCIQDLANRSFFSGIIANDYWNWVSYEAEFDFKTWPSDQADMAYADGKDDDVIGLIFKAKDVNNFYLLLWEADFRVYHSWRTGELEGFNVFKDGETEWEKRCVKSNDYMSSDADYNNYVQNLGWGQKHYRVYKVVNGDMTRVWVNDVGDGGGWDYEELESMKVHSIGNKVTLYTSRHGNSNYQKLFEFNTDWDEGSFGVCDFSQAVKFYAIRVRKWDGLSGRYPSSGWNSWTGIGGIAIARNVNDYLSGSVAATLPSPGTPYEITSATGEVRDSTTGSVSTSAGNPLIVQSYNPPNAGQMLVQSFTKKNTVTITPDNINPSTSVTAFDDMTQMFNAEMKQFRETHPNLSNIQPEFELVSPAPGDPQYQFDGKKLTFWEGEAPLDSKTIEYKMNVSAYQGWVDRDLSEFAGGKWVTYTVTFHNNSLTVNPKYDSWQWKINGAVDTTNTDKDVLQIKTTEWYKGIFPADIHNEGIVTSDNIVHVDIPPDHEHFVEPTTGDPMIPVFDKMEYLLRKIDVGKFKFVWMYWEGTPGITTKNTTTPVNVINGYPVIKTNLQNDRVIIVCDKDPRYVPWTSGKYIGYGKVNGKRPFFGSDMGKANMTNVPLDVIYLPDNLVHIQGPFVETDDDRIIVNVDSMKNTANFSSDFKDAYIWYTQWYTDWVEDSRSFFADMLNVTSIEDAIQIDPTLSPDYDSNVLIDGVEVTSNNPFVSTWTTDKASGKTGLIGTYYKFPLNTRLIKQGFVVTGDYHVKSQTFHIDESKSQVIVNGNPASDTFTAAETQVTGTVTAKTSMDVKSLYVAPGQSELIIVGNFDTVTGDHYPDLSVIAPNGESFGIEFSNGTWNVNSVTLTAFEDGSMILSASSYTFSGETAGAEVMTFANPIEGTWKIGVYNQGVTDAHYGVSTNISRRVLTDFTLSHQPDPWSIQVKVNGTVSNPSNWALNADDTLHTTLALNQSDIIRVDYTSGGSLTDALPMQDTFTFFESIPFTILSVKKNGVSIPESTSDGYEVTGNTFKIHGSYVTPGDIVVKYSLGQPDHVFTLDESPGHMTTVYLNGAVIDPSYYTVVDTTLTVNPDILNVKDWVHIQSYKEAPHFDLLKENYLGDERMQRIDQAIDFNWGLGSPFAETAAASMMDSKDIRVEDIESIPDLISFDYDVEMQITYPDQQPIDLSSFTGVWKKWDENVGTDVGDWHGPPESGYDKITNLANQSYRSGWYHPDHVNFTDYTFSFDVQEINSGDDDMYGAIFRFNPNTFNFYSFEMDAALSRTAQQGAGGWGTGVNGMAIYRNICTNPSQYGTVRLTYNKVKLAHLDEGWTYGAQEINNIQVKLLGNRIQVLRNGILKFDIVDDSPDALAQGAWGPVTQSQPKTYFSNLNVTKYKTATVNEYASFLKHFHFYADRPVSDQSRTMEIPVDANQIQNEFSQAFAQFLGDHSTLTIHDLIIQYSILNDKSPDKVFFNNNHVVKILELSPSKLKPNPLGKTFIQQAVEKYGNFNPYEKITVTQDIYENWSKYSVEDFDVLTFTPCDCNVGQDLLSADMMNFVRRFKQEGKVVIFTHDTAGLINFRTLEIEFGFVYAPSSTYTRHSTVKPLTTEDWMTYPYNLNRTLNVTPTHINSIPQGGGGYVFVDEPSLQWIKHVDNIFYSEIGDHHYGCDGSFTMQPTDDEMMVWINLMMRVAVWRNETAHSTVTLNNEAETYADVTTIPTSGNQAPTYGDYTHTIPTYNPETLPAEIVPDYRSEPWIPSLVVPPDTDLSNGFSVNWRGYVFAPVTGRYQFFSTSDDGFKLWVNQTLIIDQWHLADSPEQTYTGAIDLEGNRWYKIEANYFENVEQANVKLEWVIPGEERKVIDANYLAPTLGYNVQAKVREATPLPWNAMIHAGHFYFQEHEHYLYANKSYHVVTPVNHQIEISPRPQQGAPIIVRDNNGNILRKVSFMQPVYDSNGVVIGIEPSLENTESFSGNGYSRYFLAYSNIDEDTLQVNVNGVTLSSDSYLFDSKNSSVTFMKNHEFDDIMEFKYKLLYSYYVDFNYDIANDKALIVLHDKYDPEKMKDMEIIYEGTKDTPFYRAEEIPFNPILNHNHRGFLFMTNKVDDRVKSVQIHVSPNHIPSNSLSKVLITGKVMDKHDNPIQYKDVQIYRNGTLVFTGKSNRAGEVYFYDQPSLYGSQYVKYEVVSDELQNMELLHFFTPDVANEKYMEIKTDKAVLTTNSGDAATITFTLRDQDWSVLTGEPILITLTDTNGIVTKYNPTTDGFGQATLHLTGSDQIPGVYTILGSYQSGEQETSSFLYMKVIGG